ncbi:MAG: hypothetical protein H6834_08840 [Planctomycetes bacterium]|nr:hypothetical protein [Planctomycetota bacterium]
MRVTSLVLAIGSSLLAGCSHVHVVQDYLVDILDEPKVELSSVYFARESYSNQDEDFIAEMKEEEARWETVIRESFDEEIADELPDASGLPLMVSISIVDIDPGNQFLRWLVLFAGGASIKAEATVGGYGTLKLEGKMGGGLFGGDFDIVLSDLGSEVAEAVIERIHHGKELLSEDS